MSEWQEASDRFWKKVDKAGPNECWNWRGGKPGKGYGRITVNGRGMPAHRLSVLLSGRPIPKGMFVDHCCRNTKCVNPRHLRVVTPRINSIENSIGPTAINASRTHCPKGHEYTEDNTRYCSRGHRTCKACQKEWHQIYGELRSHQRKSRKFASLSKKGHEYMAVMKERERRKIALAKIAQEG